MVWTTFLIALAALVWILVSVTIRGLSAFSWDFVTNSMRNVSPLREGGGLLHALVGTLEQVGMAALIAVPISILVAIYLVEYGTGRLAHVGDVLRRRHDRCAVHRRRSVHLHASGC